MTYFLWAITGIMAVLGVTSMVINEPVSGFSYGILALCYAGLMVGYIQLTKLVEKLRRG